MIKKVLPTDRNNAVIMKLRNFFGNNANIQPGYIRLEKQITPQNVAETFTFGAGRQNGLNRDLERFLSQNDIFVALELGVFLQKFDRSLAGNNGNSVNYSYPDLEVFNFAGAPGNQSEAAALEAIYNGSISLKSNTYEVIDKLSLQEFRKTPQTQFFGGSAATTIVPATHASLGEIGGGFSPIHVVPVFEGKKRNELKFEPAPGADLASIAGDPDTKAVNNLVFHMKGYTVRNVSEASTLAELTRQGVLI